MNPKPFSKEVLRLDCPVQARRITDELRRLLGAFRRRGFVVALSGGIDSTVTAALCVQAVGPERVFGVHMPDRDSSPETLRLSQAVATRFGFASVLEDITGVLEATGCYSRQAEAVRLALPEFGPGWKFKIVLENILDHSGFNFFQLVARSPEGATVTRRLPLQSYLGIVAATNFKQRARKMLEYYHADRLNYAVTGTPNRLEYDQGFFVKLGDGAGDVKPIAHLYKSQVYQLGDYLGVPPEILRRPPTTDTYSLAQGQDEFFFSLPHEKLDLCLFAKNHEVAPDAVAAAIGLTTAQVLRVFQDIDAKRAATRYLHLPPLLVEPVGEVHHAV